MDHNREIRAMCLMCLPAPPMPMLVSKCVMDEASYVSSEEAVGNSHDLIAHLSELPPDAKRRVAALAVGGGGTAARRDEILFATPVPI